MIKSLILSLLLFTSENSLLHDKEVKTFLKKLKENNPTIKMFVAEGTRFDAPCPTGCRSVLVFTKFPNSDTIQFYNLITVKSKINVLLLSFPKQQLDYKLLEFLSKD